MDWIRGNYYWEPITLQINGLNLKIVFLRGGEEMEHFPNGVFHWSICRDGRLLAGGFDQWSNKAEEQAEERARRLSRCHTDTAL